MSKAKPKKEYHPKPAPVSQSSGMAIAAFVLSLVGFSILAIIFGAMTRKEPLGKAGLIIGIVGAVLEIILIIVIVAVTVKLVNDTDYFLNSHCRW